jgi:hypothetical protein
MDLGVYGLFRPEPASAAEAADNYAAIWMNPTNSEVVFARYFLVSRGATDIPNVGRYDGPNGYHNWGSNTPTQNLVDAYRMVCGGGCVVDQAKPVQAPQCVSRVLHADLPPSPAGTGVLTGGAVFGEVGQSRRGGQDGRWDAVGIEHRGQLQHGAGQARRA